MDAQNDARNQYARTGTLEPLKPDRAKSLYLKSRSDELADRSLKLHEKHVESFVEWCQQNEVENMNDVTARAVHEYKLHIKDGFAQSTLSIYLSTVRQFVEFCESIDGVAGGTSEKIVLPDRDRNARTEMLDPEEADTILAYLRRYHYASRTHALLALLWHTGIRTGTTHALDFGGRKPVRSNAEGVENYLPPLPDVVGRVRPFSRISCSPGRYGVYVYCSPEESFSKSRYRNVIQITIKWLPLMPIDMRRTTQTHGSGTTVASTVTLRGLAATTGIGATLLAAVVAPMTTAMILTGVLAVISVGALFRSVRSPREQTETDDQHRTIHRLLTEVASAT